MTNKTLAEVKEIMKTDKVFETVTTFLVNDFGKYRPNITFLFSKEFEGNPLAKRTDKVTRSMFQNMGIDFNGETSALFGDFWVSKKGGPCFRPKPIQEAMHVLVRCGWGGAFSRTRGIGHLDGVLYSHHSASNGGGMGVDYVVVPLGFYRIVRDPEIDGDTVSSVQNFAERAKAIREEFARYDCEPADNAAAAAKAKADADAASREAKANLQSRLEAISARLVALGSEPVELGEVTFGSQYNPRLYTEGNVASSEREVAQLEEKEKLRSALRKLSADLSSAAEMAECQLQTGDPESSWGSILLVAHDVNLERRSRCSLEGVEQIRKALPVFLKEVEAKRFEARQKIEKEALEQKLREQGMPTDFTCHHERGHGRTNRQCWVIQPDGKEREADEEVYVRHKHVATKWNVLRPGEIALMWEKGSAASAHHFTVVHLLAEAPTDEQVETICAILEGIEQRWEGARGFASGDLSPDVGSGWLHPVTGKSLTSGFKTSRQQLQSGHLPTSQPNLDEPIKLVYRVKSVNEGGESASADELAALRARFSK
ncbi:MAG: hypothetical protein ABL962_13010 [Fimbriimonadaceae bacterium]